MSAQIVPTETKPLHYSKFKTRLGPCLLSLQQGREEAFKCVCRLPCRKFQYSKYDHGLTHKYDFSV